MSEPRMMQEMSRDVLLVTEMTGSEACGRALGGMLQCEVEVAGTRRLALQSLRRREFGAVLVDDSLIEADPEWADQIWSCTGMAMPLRVNFAISGAPRLAREVRTLLMRRDGEHEMARRAVTAELENELKGSVSGLLLQTELALREAVGVSRLEPKLRNVVELVGVLQMRLRGTQA